MTESATLTAAPSRLKADVWLHFVYRKYSNRGKLEKKQIKIFNFLTMYLTKTSVFYLIIYFCTYVYENPY